MNREQLAFYVHHQPAPPSNVGRWVGTCPAYPRMGYWADTPAEALAGIRRFSFHKADLEARYGA